MEDYLVSLGDSNDRGLFVWDFKKEQRVTSNKLGRIVNAFEFETNQKYFVTAGYSHLKFWYFDKDTNKAIMHYVDGHKEGIMESFGADITKVKNQIFVGIACKHSCVYAFASDGHLYVFTEDRKLSRWMNIKVTRGFSCSISQSKDQLFCACADGVVRIFNPETLAHLTTL
jgi:WD40 repeat protein